MKTREPGEGRAGEAGSSHAQMLARAGSRRLWPAGVGEAPLRPHFRACLALVPPKTPRQMRVPAGCGVTQLRACQPGLWAPAPTFLLPQAMGEPAPADAPSEALHPQPRRTGST